jgi:hypothetical protein
MRFTSPIKGQPSNKPTSQPTSQLSGSPSSHSSVSPHVQLSGLSGSPRKTLTEAASNPVKENVETMEYSQEEVNNIIVIYSPIKSSSSSSIDNYHIDTDHINNDEFDNINNDDNINDDNINNDNINIDNINIINDDNIINDVNININDDNINININDDYININDDNININDDNININDDNIDINDDNIDINDDNIDTLDLANITNRDLSNMSSEELFQFEHKIIKKMKDQAESNKKSKKMNSACEKTINIVEKFYKEIIDNSKDINDNINLDFKTFRTRMEVLELEIHETMLLSENSLVKYDTKALNLKNELKHIKEYIHNEGN